MDRAIKFRVWSLKNKCWCYPVLDITNDFNIKNKDSEYQYVFMQFTGLYDSEGKEVWEGDVIEYTQHHFNTELIKVKRKVVKWNNDRWNIYETAAGETDIKVIGNIYEHPDLLNNER